MILKARYVVPVSSLPIENGAVEVRGSTIVTVRRATRHESGPSVIDCGDAVLLPGFVNAHTHLELTHLAGLVAPIPPPETPSPGCGPNFTGWLGQLFSAIRDAGETPDGAATSVQRGAALSLEGGVTTIGDITRRPEWTRPILAHGRLRVVSFGEVIAIGSIHDRLEARLNAASDTAHDTERLAAALSPHAPYTCDRRAIRACVTAAAEHKMRLCMHLAETEDETRCTLAGDGPLVEYARSLGVWTDEVKHPGLRPIAYAAELGVLGPRTVLAHVNYANDDDIALLARHAGHIAYCPRTHAAFRHSPHRFPDMLRAGVNVCVGTDSLASNPSLSVLEELRFLRREHEDLPSDLILEMGTLRGARALGLSYCVGSLEAGKDADLVVIPHKSRGPSDPIENVLQSDQPPAQVYVMGRRII